jgi:hypothetical protein
MSVEDVLADLHTAVAAVGGKFEEEGEPIEGAAAHARFRLRCRVLLVQ